MIFKKFFDWALQQSDATHSSFATNQAQTDSIQSSQTPAFSNSPPPALPSLEIPQETLQDILESHINDLKDIQPEHQHLQEALALATNKHSLLSDSQKSSAILSLLGEKEAVLLIHNLRWKHGVVCPFCGSIDIQELTHHIRQYKCRHCDGGDYNGEFDVLTGYFPKGDSHSARIWVLINYLRMFMPLSKIAKVLGISLEQALVILSMMSPNQQEKQKHREKKILAPKKDGHPF